MRLAVVSLGGYSSKLIAEKARAYFSVVDEINLKNVDVRVFTGAKEAFYEDRPLPDYDCIFVRGSFRYELLQRTLSEVKFDDAYLPLRPEAFINCHNKLLTLLALQKYNLPVPTTYFASTADYAKKILGEVNYPIILKIPHGTQGKGVMFADSLPSAKSMLDALEVFGQPYLIQEYIETGATDVRAIVVGDKVVGCMRRKAASNELRANIQMGGVGEPYQ